MKSSFFYSISTTTLLLSLFLANPALSQSEADTERVKIKHDLASFNTTLPQDCRSPLIHNAEEAITGITGTTSADLVTMRLDIAHAYLQANCLDDAERAYQAVVAQHPTAAALKDAQNSLSTITTVRKSGVPYAVSKENR